MFDQSKTIYDWSFIFNYRGHAIVPVIPNPTPPEGPTAMLVGVISPQGENLSEDCFKRYEREQYIHDTSRVQAIAQDFIDDRIMRQAMAREAAQVRQ